jgi:hypothetical protein
MKIEGALTKRFLRHDGIYRSDVSSLLFTPGPLSRFPVGPVPGYRTIRAHCQFKSCRNSMFRRPGPAAPTQFPTSSLSV